MPPPPTQRVDAGTMAMMGLVSKTSGPGQQAGAKVIILVNGVRMFHYIYNNIMEKMKIKPDSWELTSEIQT